MFLLPFFLPSHIYHIYKNKFMVFLNLPFYLTILQSFSHVVVHVCIYVFLMTPTYSSVKSVFPYPFFPINCLNTIELRAVVGHFVEKYFSDNPNLLQCQLLFSSWLVLFLQKKLRLLTICVYIYRVCMCVCLQFCPCVVLAVSNEITLCLNLSDLRDHLVK